MCWSKCQKTTYAKPKIAKRDKVVWKEGNFRSSFGEKVFTSEYRGYVYHLNQIQPKIKLNPIEEVYPQRQFSYLTTIKKGYHSYIKPITPGFWMNKIGLVLAKCIIPKGTKYYNDGSKGEIVSETIKVIEIIEGK